MGYSEDFIPDGMNAFERNRGLHYCGSFIINIFSIVLNLLSGGEA